MAGQPIQKKETRIVAGPLILGAGIAQPRYDERTHRIRLNQAATGAASSLALPRTLTTGVLGLSSTLTPSGSLISLT